MEEAGLTRDLSASELLKQIPGKSLQSGEPQVQRA